MVIDKVEQLIKGMEVVSLDVGIIGVLQRKHWLTTTDVPIFLTVVVALAYKDSSGYTEEGKQLNGSFSKEQGILCVI